MKHFTLSERAVLSVSGPDSGKFLQNLLTADVLKMQENTLIYACFLSPQGNILHAVFVKKEVHRYLLDCNRPEIGKIEALLKKLKLRSQVSFEEIPGCTVQVALGPGTPPADFLPDPRLASLGWRGYVMGLADSGLAPEAAYDDACILAGVPPDSAIRHGKDYIADLNFDVLGAVDWNKGCFIGQELTARMYHRGLAKKRLVIVRGDGLSDGDRIKAGDIEVGEIRRVDGSGKTGLALLKLEALGQELHIPEKEKLVAEKPIWLLGKN